MRQFACVCVFSVVVISVFLAFIAQMHNYFNLLEISQYVIHIYNVEKHSERLTYKTIDSTLGQVWSSNLIWLEGKSNLTHRWNLIGHVLKYGFLLQLLFIFYRSKFNSCSTFSQRQFQIYFVCFVSRQHK